MIPTSDGGRESMRITLATVDAVLRAAIEASNRRVGEPPPPSSLDTAALARIVATRLLAAERECP